MLGKFVTGGLAAGAIFAASAAAASTIEISITNDQPDGGLFLTPLFTAVHDGSFDLFDNGAPASAALEDLAETGNPAGLVAAADAAGAATGVITSPGGFAGAPVIDPGETASIRLTVDPDTQRWLSFASMIIPSNDAFIGNGNPLAWEIFDASGAFIGLPPIEVTRYYDAGTEANDNIGAAFNGAGGAATDTMDGVSLLTDLSFLLGQSTVAGTVVSALPTGSLATISVSEVPLPASLPLMAFALAGMVGVRKARQATA